MGQAIVDNGTPFAAAPLFLSDEEGRPLLVLVVKGTWDLDLRRGGAPALAAAQAAVNLAGEPFHDEGPSSLRYEPECAFFKPATDVALVGSAHAPRTGTAEVLVGFQVGPLRKGVRVIGDRAFYKAVGGVGMTRPLPFESIPLVWERAFGGWDRSDPDASRHEVEARNPLGAGFRGRGARFEDGLRCPNLEDPARPLRGFGDRPPPCGVGFVSPDFQPRAALAGTYGEAWQAERAPLLPRDFDRRFFNAAAPGLVAQGYLRGDEQVAATSVTKAGGVAFRLPGLPPPLLRIEHAGRADLQPAMHLDTVIVDTDAGRLSLLWRALATVREPGAVRTISVRFVAGQRAA